MPDGIYGSARRVAGFAARSAEQLARAGGREVRGRVVASAPTCELISSLDMRLRSELQKASASGYTKATRDLDDARRRVNDAASILGCPVRKR